RTKTRPRSLDGGHPIQIVVTDDGQVIAHLGNAGRPRTINSRYNSNPLEVSTKVLTPRAHTGNARPRTSPLGAPDRRDRHSVVQLTRRRVPVSEGWPRVGLGPWACSSPSVPALFWSRGWRVLRVCRAI